MKTYFNLNAPASNMPPVGDSRNNVGIVDITSS